MLVAYAEAVIGDEQPGGGGQRLDRARRELLATLGPAALVDAAATVASFNAVVRVASATGIPLDDITVADDANLALFESLGIDRLETAE